MEENNEVRAVVTWECQEKDQGGDQEGDGWIASEWICRHCGLPWRKEKDRNSGNQEFGLLIPSSGKRRRRRSLFGVLQGSHCSLSCTHSFDVSALLPVTCTTLNTPFVRLFTPPSIPLDTHHIYLFSHLHIPRALHSTNTVSSGKTHTQLNELIHIHKVFRK